jgi:multiple sugar transport system permease protein
MPLAVSQRKKTIHSGLVWAALLVWLLPLAAMILTSVRTSDDIARGNYWGVPETIGMGANYSAVLMDTPLALYMLNSVLLSGLVVIGAVAISALGGYALAKYRFPGNTLLFAIFIIGNFVPAQILMIPVRNLTVTTGLYDTITGLALFHIAFQSGFCTLFMRNFIRAIPNELFEAARMDGVGPFGIFRHVVLPLIVPAIASLSVLTFTFIWNDYFWALVLTQGDNAKPVTVGLQSLAGQWVTAWHLISAGAIVAAMPPVILFFFMQKHLVAGLTLGAVKS